MPKRILMDNAVYHVMCRGNRKERVFHSSDDYERFEMLLWRYKIKFDIRIYAYCLMPNHIHLVLDPSNNKDLNKMMHGLNLSYAMWFNKKYEKTGHLWQDRFKSNIIQKDVYLLNCITYIETNPIRAKKCESLESYKWSSYAHRFLGKTNRLIDELKL